MKAYCLKCGKEEETSVSKEVRQYTVRGIRVGAEVTVLRCLKCLEEAYDYEIEKTNDSTINDSYKKAVGLLTSKDMKKKREDLGYSQKEFAHILHRSEKDIRRYENGSIQTKAYDRLIRQIKAYR